MIPQLVALSVKFRVLVLGVAAVVFALGAVQLQDAPVDTLPEFLPPHVQIQTEALGLSAAEVEQLITVPIEHDLLNGIAWLDQIQSESVPGLSSIDLWFKPGTDPLKARQVVQERMTQAHALPQVGTPPVIIPPVSSTSRVMMIGLSSKELSLVDLSVLARWKIKPRLTGVAGVANVTIWGQRDRQLQVQVDPARLRANGVTLNQVISTTGNALWVSPLTFVEASTPGTGGFIDTSNQRFGIQHVSPITTAKGLASVTIEDTRGTRLDSVATVVEDHQPLVGDAVLSDGPGVMLVIEKFPGADTRAVTRGVEEAMEALRPGLSGVEIDTSVYQAQTFIERALGNVGSWALAGLILLVALLLLGFSSWRMALIGFVAILVSLVTAGYVLYLTGATFNVMVLAGLAVALGLVIDDAVVDLGNIRSVLSEQRASGGATSTVAAIAASSLGRGPQSYATLIALLAALPLFFVGGVAGSLAGPAALSYVVALLSSTLVALTVTPALAATLLRNEPVKRRTSPVVRWTHRLFDKTVPPFVRKPRWAYATIGALLLLGCSAVPQVNSGSLLPSPQDRSLLVHWTAAPGTSLPEMTRITNSVVQELGSIPGVRHVGGHVGRAVTSDQIVDVNSGEIWISLADSADYNGTVTAIGHVLHGYPGLRSDLATYPQDRLRAGEAGTSDPVVVRLYGIDLDTLRAKAEEVRQRISTVPGVVKPRVQALSEEPTLEVRVDLPAAQRYGLNPGDVRRAATTFYSGLLVGNLYEDQKVFDVVVRGTSSTGATPAEVADLLIDTPDGSQVRLGDVATVRVVPYPTAIRHDATLRSLDVTAAVRGRDLGAVMDDVRTRVRTVPMPLEYHAEVIGDRAERESQNRQTAALAVAVAIAIFLVLHAALGSWRLAVLVFLTLPLAAAGGFVGAFLAGGGASLGAAIGFLTVLGIAARNGVSLVNSYQRLESTAGGPPSAEAVLGATRERVGPVLLTAAATIAATLPLVLFGTVAGIEVLHPLAAVVLGGLIASTLLAVFVLPALYIRLSPVGRGPRSGSETGEPRPEPPVGGAASSASR